MLFVPVSTVAMQVSTSITGIIELHRNYAFFNGHAIVHKWSDEKLVKNLVILLCSANFLIRALFFVPYFSLCVLIEQVPCCIFLTVTVDRWTGSLLIVWRGSQLSSEAQVVFHSFTATSWCHSKILTELTFQCIVIMYRTINNQHTRFRIRYWL